MPEERVRELKLELILTKQQIKEIEAYLRSQKKAGIKAIDSTEGLKEILKKYRDELLVKDVDWGYLAYAIAWEYTRRGM